MRRRGGGEGERAHDRVVQAVPTPRQVQILKRLDRAEGQDRFGRLLREGVDRVGVDGDLGKELLEEAEEARVRGAHRRLDERRSWGRRTG